MNVNLFREEVLITSGAHGLVVIGIRPLSQRLLVQTLLWTLNNVVNLDKRLYLIVSVYQAEIGYQLMLGVNL